MPAKLPFKSTRRTLAKTSSTTPPVADTHTVNIPDVLKTKFSKRIGISPDTLKVIFSKNTAERAETEEGKATNKLIDLIKNRICDGRTMNLRSHRVWAAIDAAYASPFNQITPTLIGKILSKRMKEEDILKELELWDISERALFTEVDLEVGGVKTKGKVLNEQMFYKTIVPLVQAYVLARTARLFLDRNQYPFLKYEAFISTEENQSLCEMITNIIERMTHQYGLPTSVRQAIQRSLMYSVQLVFPTEAWHYEDDADEDGKKFTKREGLRYALPHPSRSFWDNLYPVSTFNTDTGCEFAGHWKVLRFGDIDNNPDYWNRNVIPYGTNWFTGAMSGRYFSELYPCVAKCPYPNTEYSPSDAERAANYATGQHDKGVFVTDFFQKLIPSQWGLGKWNYPVWFRFVVASDDMVIYAEPLPYCPVLYMGADVDENRSDNPSLALNIIPWQDHLGNIISQILLSARQNLAKLVYYDTEQVDEATIEMVKHRSNAASGIAFIPFNSKKSKMANVDMSRMFVPVQFPLQNTAELTNVIGTVISIMERLLGMSAQEVGASGQHVQTAEEMRVITSNTSSRSQFTGTYVDDFLDAAKRQRYIAAREYMDEAFVTQISMPSPEVRKRLEALGFSFEGESDKAGKIQVKGNKSVLTKRIPLESFVSARDGQNRINQPQVAQILMQTIGQIAGNPELAKLVGPKQILDALNRATTLAGAPKDFKMSADDSGNQTNELAMLQQQIAQMAESIKDAAVKETGAAIEQVAGAVKQQGEAIGETASKVQEIFNTLQKLQEFVGVIIQNQQSLPAPAPQEYDTQAVVTG